MAWGLGMVPRHGEDPKMPQAAMPSSTRGIPRSRLTEYAITAVLVVGAGLVLWHAWAGMRAQGVIGDFSVLLEQTKWDVSSSVMPHSPAFPYWKTLLMALGNTLCIGIPAIILSTALGVAIGVARTGTNKALAGLARLFVDIFRNVPAILQIVFWYAVLLNGPSVSKALDFGHVAFLSNRGFWLPFPVLPATLWWLAFTACILVPLAALAWHQVQMRRIRVLQAKGEPVIAGADRLLAGALLLTLAVVIAILVLAPYDVPARKGLNYRGGISVSIEFLALLLGLVIYGTAYIAEIVRGGLNSVPKGQIEAARSLGLSKSAIFFRVTVPLALRLVIPPLSNQYLFLMKGTGLGLAVGYAEVFQITVTSINQTGKSIDFLIVMMVIYGILNYSIGRLMALANKRLALRRH